MIASLLLLASLQLTAEECREPEPAPVPDVAGAQLYASVGDQEAAANRPQVALVAYRDGLRLDPGNAHLRARWVELCRISGGNSDRFDEAVRYMEARDWTKAAERFRAIRVENWDASAALLEGICDHELKDDQAAATALRDAATDPALSASANFFEGLIALQAGDKETARLLLRVAAASQDTRLHQSAVDLLDVAHGTGRLRASAEVDVGYDSNVSLTPNGDASLPGAQDGFATAGGVLEMHPWLGHGLVLGLSGFYRQEFTLEAFNLGGGGARAGWELDKSQIRAVALYSFDGMVYGGTGYLLAHRFLARTEYYVRGWTLSGEYSARIETYLPSLLAGYSGIRHVGALALRRDLPGQVAVELGYGFSYDGTQDATVSYVEHGPRAAVWWHPISDLRFGVEGILGFRSYEEAAASEPIRSDAIVDTAGFGSWSFAQGWSAEVRACFRVASSNISDFTYNRVVLSAAISSAWGLW